MPCPTFKRFPRTTQEAYGPYTSREVYPMEDDDKPTGYPLLWWAAMTVVAALAVVGIVASNLPVGVQ
jgi:hypothetical protein